MGAAVGAVVVEWRTSGDPQSRELFNGAPPEVSTPFKTDAELDAEVAGIRPELRDRAKELRKEEMLKAEQRYRDNMEALFGRQLAPREIAELVGAPAGAKVFVSGDYAGGLMIRVEHPLYQSQLRGIQRGKDGKLEMENNVFKLNKAAQGNGVGVRVFARQVDQASKLGVERIVTQAKRSKSMNGYYTWARLGYDAAIPKRVANKLPAELKGAKNVSDLMRTKAGRDWWKQNGTTVDMTFDLSRGSHSRRILEGYEGERGVNVG